MTEFGYFGTVDSPAIDGVFSANSYATALEDGVQSVHWLEMSKNSFLSDSGALTRGAAFYGIQLLSQVAPPGATWLTTSDNSSGNNDVETHATLLADGSIGLLIVNLGSDSTRDVDRAAASLRITIDTALLLEGKNVLAVVARRSAENQRRSGRRIVGNPAVVQVFGPTSDYKRSLFNGLAQVIVQSTTQPGEIVLTASSLELVPYRLVIETRAANSPALAQSSVERVSD